MRLNSFLETAYGLLGNPFPGDSMYAQDQQNVYVPEMFGDQLKEFRMKFFVSPLESKRPMMGAVWSAPVLGDPMSRGYGKSTLMGEEAKLINRDFGFDTLRWLGVDEDEALAHPILAGYVSFDNKGAEGISSMEAAGFHLVRFMLKGGAHGGYSTHARLRERAVKNLYAQGRVINNEETAAIIAAMRARFSHLGVSVDLNNKSLHQFLLKLASPDSEQLDEFLAQDVKTWHHNRIGMKYLQLFVAFAEIAGIKHITCFIDQVEDFTFASTATKIQKNVKIMRDAFLESEPLASRVSFIYQLHPDAWMSLQKAWIHEDMRDLSPNIPRNQHYIVDLKGLETFDSALTLTRHYLNHPQFAAPGRKAGLCPFTEGALNLVWSSNKLPRHFLNTLSSLIEAGKASRADVIDEKFALSILGDDPEPAPRARPARRSGTGADSRLA